MILTQDPLVIRNICFRLNKGGNGKCVSHVYTSLSQQHQLTMLTSTGIVWTAVSTDDGEKRVFFTWTLKHNWVFLRFFSCWEMCITFQHHGHTHP